MGEDHRILGRRRFLSSVGLAGASLCFGNSWAKAEPTKEEKVPFLIDCHIHVHHFQRSLADTIKHMDATGSRQAFFLPLETGEGGVLFRPDEVLEAYRQYPDRVIPFCQCDVRKPDVFRRIRDYYRLGCRGVGEQKEHVSLGDRRIEGVIALCNELDWSITLHFEDGPKGFNQGLADYLEGYLKRYRRVRILAHAQTWWANISADVPPPEKTHYPKGRVKPGGLVDRLLSEYPNLYADLSAESGYNALSRDPDFAGGFLERHRKQLVFGSDCPCWDGRGGHFPQGCCYSMRLQRFLRQMVRDEQALRDIFHNNALRALKGTAA
jgi:predicted TIM-barrel fold metal-dependent hydrolase